MRSVLLACVLLAASCGGKKDDKKDPGAGSAAGSGSAPPAVTTPGSAAPTGSAAPAAPAGTPAEPGGKLSNDTQSAKLLPCDKQARDVEGNEGSSWFMKCPACPGTTGGVWGTDLYTDDSRVCLAAIHAGAITHDGGILLVTWVGGQSTYVGSVRNGISTNDYGAWSRSFFVQSVNAQGQPSSPAVTPPPKGTIRMSCAMGANVWTAKEPVRIQCPPGCGEGPLWGTDTYTADSAACVAAVHAGLLTAAQGGEVQLTPGGKVDKLVGSERNGVVSNDYGAYEQTFKLSK